MKYNTISNFPDEVDPLLFFQDITIKDAEFHNKYQSLLIENKYDDAIALNTFEGSDVFTYTAGLFNLFVSRIKATQTFLKESEGTFLDRETLSDTEPTNMKLNQIWIALDN